ncbi:ulp1 protease family, C-terminal catalytic domain-containing protein [Tanacetum coccineum]|uniref:Ulp1 protease family, C-terminal catalytic domain-containing protein n=1 Tax=Tanacetum coccineum TaxID=301880 RepID=A0ABQ4YHH6_9ASTR
MLKVLMNGIACDLEKEIQQHPGDKEIKNIKLQWKEMLLKRASEMNKKDKERPREHIFEVDRDKQGASRLKDMDFKNKSECTNWEKHSKISALTPKTLSSFDAQFDPVKVHTSVTPDIKRKRKDFDKENISKEANDKDSKKMKQIVKPSDNVKSPFLESDYLFVTEEGFGDVRGVIESLYLGITVHVGVINMWSQVCNFEEGLRSPDSMRRLFCHSSMISEKTLNEKNNVKALSYFIDDMEFVMKSAKVDNISNIDMVLFLVLLAKSYDYLIVFNLKTPKIEILDNSKNGINVALDERYGESLTKLYLSYSEQRSWNSMRMSVCERLEMSWRTENNITDCGIFLMRYMETDMGYAKNWKCGFKNEGWEQQTQIYDLRKKYLSKILKSDLNCKKTFVLNELDQFRKLPNEEKVKFLKDMFVLSEWETKSTRV